MKAFISALLGYDPEQKNLEGGILGIVDGYHGCVEAQGRGTLHCHMALSFDPSDVDFCTRLLRVIPPKPEPNVDAPSNQHHPCCVRGIPISEQLSDASGSTSSLSGLSPERQQDLQNVALKCQSHEHSKTCFKYWRGPPEPKSCRFDLHEDNVRTESSFDSATGEISLRCLDGPVNNFNETVLEAMRCNMDIKFIGDSVHITDYITTSQLETHVAFSMLELAVRKLGEINPLETDITKCAYAMISQQELPAQQVASYLLDFEDHFTSHCYRSFY
ncbi:hypothetical protein DFH08DRAFT_916479 [Mycena albidolilacea]|uniref:Helitron helicase-like domain-containing protein n=1 Tax=Mycena albidolilacea TaxID=1033008 RepID=A0AAD7ELH8_9AGAR|nr:hypothetical protein DFH08DRAFT_916479 [Mycena albidolilacea]